MSKKKDELSLNYKVERSNELNKLVPKGWTLTEVRFLAIYQAKINARNPDSRAVTFPLETFCKIMEIKRLNITQMKETVRSLLSKPVFLPNDKNGFIGISLFHRCELKQENNGEWFIKIECHPDALPYMFEMKKNYFTYELWNALSLSSVNQIRMYEILKQYEKIGNRIIEVEELKRLLGIEKNQYNSFKNFRVRVLESCQKALEQYTDISYTFEPIRRGRKIYALKFTITKNKDFKDNLRLKEFIKPEDLSDINEEIPIQIEKSQEKPVEKEKLELSSTFDGSYLPEQLESLLDIARSVSDSPEAYLKSIYYQIKARNKKINNLYSYTLSIINADLKNCPRKSIEEKETVVQEEGIRDKFEKNLSHGYRTTRFNKIQECYFNSAKVSAMDIYMLLEDKFNIHDGNIFDIHKLQSIIDYIFSEYNILLIDTNTTGFYDEEAF